jgi:hypothetical protein
MVLVKVLKRRDAASVIVAILLAMIISQPLSMMTGKPASIISGLSGNNNAGYFWYGYGGGGGWESQYLFPVVWVILQIIVLEILAWIYVLISRPFSRKRR